MSGLHPDHTAALARYLLARATESREAALLHAWAGDDAHADQHRAAEYATLLRLERIAG